MAWEPVRNSRLSVGPPGALFYGATTISVIVALDAASRPSLGRFAFVALIGLGIAGLWFGRFAIAAWRSRVRIPQAHWIRWLAVPVLLGLVAVAGYSGAVFDARLAFSRGAMDQLAAKVTAGGPMRSGWVGLYEVSEPERTANGFRFVIDDYGLYRIGFAYSPNGKPELAEDNYSPLWDFTVFEPVGEGWWLWGEEWD